MKPLTKFAVLSALGLSLMGTQLVAGAPADETTSRGKSGQANPNAEKAKRSSPDVLPNAQTPQGPGLGLGLGLGNKPDQPGRPDKPEKPDHPDTPRKTGLPDEVQQLVDEFKTARDKFIVDQQELVKQIRTSAEEQRETLREQAKANRDAWLEKQKELRQEIRERVKELRDQLPRHKDLLDEAKEKAGERRKGP